MCGWCTLGERLPRHIVLICYACCVQTLHREYHKTPPPLRTHIMGVVLSILNVDVDHVCTVLPCGGRRGTVSVQCMTQQAHALPMRSVHRLFVCLSVIVNAFLCRILLSVCLSDCHCKRILCRILFCTDFFSAQWSE